MHTHTPSTVNKQLSFFCTVFGRLSMCAVSMVFLTACLNATKVSPQHTDNQSSINEQFYQASADVLKANFKNPPEQVKPWVYWYWVSDNISKNGIEKDLAAMQKAGINTALIGIIHLQGKEGDVKALTEPWWDHVRFAIKKAAEYDVDIGLFNSPGWSQSGGPWVDFDKSMRYLDNQEFSVVGPKQYSMTLPTPGTKGMSGDFYQDVKVVAFKTPTYEKDRLTPRNSKITLSNPTAQNTLTQQDIAALFDNEISTSYHLPASVLNHNDKGPRNGQLQVDFQPTEAFQARTLELYPHHSYRTNVTLSAKNAAGQFEQIKTFEMQRPRDMAAIGPDHDAPIVVTFPAVESDHFRLTFNGFHLGRKKQTDEAIGFKEIVLSKAYKLERFSEKKLAKVFPNPMPKFDTYQWPLSTPTDAPQLLVKENDVIDITEFVKDGQLNWQVPAGDWTIIRYFMRPTGTKNSPSSKPAQGPEIDKQNKEIAQFHFDAYIGKFLSSMPAEDRTALKYAVVDSYEKGAQNWTDGFAEKFQARYGYDPIPYLPVYSGRAVNSVEKSERFLWDVRRLVADGVAYEYTAGLRERARENGLKLWLENYGHWGFPGEFLQYGGQADIVSGEFWASGNLGAIELKAASSAAHIYGQKTVMSESFTSGRSDSFKHHPWTFKKRGDWSFVEGVNHTLLHVYIHQAYDDRFPGVNAWFGSEFNRNNTWFDYMGTWLDYIKRANYMMQQGKYVADIMYFIGEDAPKMTGELNPAVPAGYSYDFINAEVILERLSFSDGYYQLPDGMRFKLLVLPNLDTMRPQVLNKIAQLVEQGGAVYGPQPIRSPSLENYPSTDKQVQRIAKQLWQNIDGKQVIQASYGKGQVFYRKASEEKPVDLAQVLTDIDTPADLTGLPEEVIWSHRSSEAHDIYFIANQEEQVVSINPSFRIKANHGQPQYFDAVTGNISDIAQFKKVDGRIEIPMQLNDLGSRFIVFEKQPSAQAQVTSNIHQVTRNGQPVLLPNHFNDQGKPVLAVGENGVYQVNNYDGSQQTIKVDNLPAAITLEQPWQLTLQENRDVPTRLTLDKLTSLTELKPVALAHYSGSIRYQTSFTVSPEWLRADQQLQLGLGEVGVIARVTVNGQNLGELWSRPLTLNIEDAVKPGTNTLTVEVATTWLNRLIGDLKYPEQFPDSTKAKSFNTDITFEGTVKKDRALQPSGLIGPVTIQPIRKVAF
ncbi:glycoside hydrolase [Paraglaciecola aquimarina]|uniref:Glycoside hydrolase n=1 Tax=Paraglaciecola algarum TaxID=3050085 RepID=A0ABS9D2H7_9ALTE|nr:glycosyl hydrolase [Paraglaciecola sp. G1-23]MCF2946930.1 glycoside hydrolase [Paraglaciecola sp. G1-23]